ncbi:MAG: hypothetical protein AAGB22_04415 [Bacteroidota bacterium]
MKGWYACLASSLLCAFALAPQAVNAQAKGGSQGTEDMVNLFTGDFNYSVPLITVSGPNGEQFPLSAHYTAGIRTAQEASWI